MPEGAESGRKLRAKERKVYVDEVDEEEIEGGSRTFSVEEKLRDDKFEEAIQLKILNGSDVTLKYFQENGFKTPILVKEKTGLGMRIPSDKFTVNDVKQCVGSRRVIDVMDVTTQKAQEMTMKEWAHYYCDKDARDQLLNVISLEFSHTRLENYVEQPEVVRQMDWVDTAWPTYLKESQTETTNIIEKMKYPKVQKYCLMSVKGCYTDFHIDMGGTSVWYHILHGGKVFWLIPPSEENLDAFEKWTKSGRQGDVFFGDRVSDCFRIKLEAGNTFFIPTGWIHAVHTPMDSLVFGGNFLHSINIDMQLRVWEIESRTHVPSKFRYPFFTEVHWYVVDRYLSCLQGKSYRIKSSDEIKADKEDAEDEFKVKLEPSERTASPSVKVDEESTDSPSPQTTKAGLSKTKSFSQSNLIRPVSVKLQNCMLMDKSKLMARNGSEKKPWIHLTPYELRGLRIMLEWMERLPPTKKLVPKDITDPDKLLTDVKRLLEDHAGDNAEEAVTGEYAIRWLKGRKPKVKVRSYTTCFPRARPPKGPKQPGSTSSGIRRRRVRCKNCEPCTRTDCRLCNFCKDMKKYGGSGRAKQTCISRQCLRPELANCATCMICNLGTNSRITVCSINDECPPGVIMECGICWEIHHPECHVKKYPDVTSQGIVNEDLPNSWECPRCVSEGKQGQMQDEIYETSSVMFGSELSLDSDNEMEGDLDQLVQKVKEDPEQSISQPSTSQLSTSQQSTSQLSTSQLSTSQQSTSTDCSFILSQTSEPPQETWLKNEDSMSAIPDLPSSSQTGISPPIQIPKLTPKYVVRPGPVPPPPKYVLMEFDNQHVLDRTIWMYVFQFLGIADLARCLRVCKTWNRWCLDAQLWRSIDLSHRKIRQCHLIGTVRRQPKILDLRGSIINRRQLAWLVARLPHLKVLNLHCNSWAAVNALCSSICPLLQTLDLSWVDGVWDACIRDLCSPPTDHRPGVDESLSRLRRCEDLSLMGTNITDKALEVIATFMPCLKKLNISYCPSITNKGLEILANQDSVVRTTLEDLSLVCLAKLNDDCFPILALMPKLESIDVAQCPQITNDGCLKFIERSKDKDYTMTGELCIILMK